MKGRLRPFRAFRCFRSFVSITRGFFEFSCQPESGTCTGIVLFDTGSCIGTQPAMLGQDFHKVVFASKAWMALPPAVRPDFTLLFNSLLAFRADSTVKRYIKEINKFLLWCRDRKDSLQLPFSSSVVVL